MLSTEPWIEIVGEAGDCAGAVRAATRLLPEIVLLDIRMAGTDGLACLEELRGLDQPPAVLIVTLYEDRGYVLEAIRRGAAGYLLKDASTAEIVSTLAKVADGQLAVDPQLLREALLAPVETARSAGSSRQRAEAYAVTPREHEVLRLVADGLTNKEIGARLDITRGHRQEARPEPDLEAACGGPDPGRHPGVSDRTARRRALSPLPSLDAAAGELQHATGV